MVSRASGRLTGRPRDRRGLSRPLQRFHVGWADQPAAMERMVSPSCHPDSPPASPMRGTEAMRLLDLPTRLGAGFATVAMADRPPSNRRLAGRDRWTHLNLIHRVEIRRLTARDFPRQVETGNDRDGLAAGRSLRLLVKAAARRAEEMDHGPVAPQSGRPPRDGGAARPGGARSAQGEGGSPEVTATHPGSSQRGLLTRGLTG